LLFQDRYAIGCRKREETCRWIQPGNTLKADAKEDIVKEEKSHRG